jgi:predicted nucleotidyltransferase
MLLAMELVNMHANKDNSKIEEREKDIAALVDIIVELIDPDKIILFGSYAYGTPNEKSDADFLVIKNGIEHTIKDEGELATAIYYKRKERGIRTRCDAFLENESQANACAEDGGAYADAFQRGKLLYVR